MVGFNVERSTAKALQGVRPLRPSPRSPRTPRGRRRAGGTPPASRATAGLRPDVGGRRGEGEGSGALAAFSPDVCGGPVRVGQILPSV